MLPTHSVYHARINTSLQLVCVAEGNPTPSVQWYKNGVAVTYYRKSFHVLYVSSKALSSTEYTCQGINHVGKRNHIERATITVKSESELIMSVLFIHRHVRNMMFDHYYVSVQQVHMMRYSRAIKFNFSKDLVLY